MIHYIIRSLLIMSAMAAFLGHHFEDHHVKDAVQLLDECETPVS